MFSREELVGDERYAEIGELLAEPDEAALSRAQEMLDGIKKRKRDAEWHYMQAAVCYHRHHYLDCKKQLLKAIEQDPQNKKYQSDYAELSAMKITEAEPQKKQMSDENASACMECCALLCMDGICSWFCDGF